MRTISEILNGVSDADLWAMARKDGNRSAAEKTIQEAVNEWLVRFGIVLELAEGLPDQTVNIPQLRRGIFGSKIIDTSNPLFVIIQSQTANEEAIQKAWRKSWMMTSGAVKDYGHILPVTSQEAFSTFLSRFDDVGKHPEFFQPEQLRNQARQCTMELKTTREAGGLMNAVKYATPHLGSLEIAASFVHQGIVSA